MEKAIAVLAKLIAALAAVWLVHGKTMAASTALRDSKASPEIGTLSDQSSEPRVKAGENSASGGQAVARRQPKVAIQVNQSLQRLAVFFKGEQVEGLDAVPISTGLPGKSTRTPDGIFWTNPREIKQRRQSHFATRLLRRPVFLTHAIQIVGGIFMHDASPPAMAYLGTQRSHGCVRVDRLKMPAIFQLVEQHPASTRIHIFH